MIATLLKRVFRIDIDISDGLCMLKYMTNCCGPDVSSSHYRYYSPDSASEKQGRSSAIQDKSGKCLTEEKEILSRWTDTLLYRGLTTPFLRSTNVIGTAEENVRAD